MVFSSFFRVAGACGVAKAMYRQFVSPTWVCAEFLIIIIIMVHTVINRKTVNENRTTIHLFKFHRLSIHFSSQGRIDF